MQPDGVHFHMLIYKRLTKGNAKTSLWILTLYTPFVVLSVVFAHHSLALIGISLVFIVFYQLIYKRLATFRL